MEELNYDLTPGSRSGDIDERTEKTPKPHTSLLTNAKVDTRILVL